MEQLTDAIGNPTALLVERIFWLGLGAFLGLAIITSLLRGLKEGKNKKKGPYLELLACAIFTKRVVFLNYWVMGISQYLLPQL